MNLNKMSQRTQDQFLLILDVNKTKKDRPKDGLLKSPDFGCVGLLAYTKVPTQKRLLVLPVKAALVVTPAS